MSGRGERLPDTRMLGRFLRFNVVSAVGIVLQLAILAALVDLLRVHYLVATVVAVELAILHNFAWHEHWTWATPGPHPAGTLDTPFLRCMAFHAGNGCVSLLGSLALMPLFVGWLHVHYLPSNLLAIAITGILNFLISDRVVFNKARLRP